MDLSEYLKKHSRTYDDASDAALLEIFEDLRSEADGCSLVAMPAWLEKDLAEVSASIITRWVRHQELAEAMNALDASDPF